MTDEKEPVLDQLETDVFLNLEGAMTPIEQSIADISRHYTILPGTLKVLDEWHGAWIARVTSSYKEEPGEFPILVLDDSMTILTDKIITGIGAWCLVQEEKL